MTLERPFYVASITKLYTAAIVLRLHERGELDIEAPMAKYLPAAITDRLHVSGGVDRTRSVTVRHLLDNTSGIASYFEDRPEGGRSLAEDLFVAGDRTWTLADLSATVRDRLVPHFPPGRRLRYSDTNYQLLGGIVESVRGRPLHVVFDEELIAPLGLRSTYLAGHPPRPDVPAPASLFFAGRPLALPRAMQSIGAQGGLVSTLHDGVAFLRALFGGRVFQHPRTLQLMQSWRRFGLPLDRAALRAPSWPIEYGLGLMRFRLPSILNGMRKMPALLGHTGSSGSWLFFAPERDLYLAGTVNEVTSGAVPYRVVPRLLRAI